MIMEYTKEDIYDSYKNISNYNKSAISIERENGLSIFNKDLIVDLLTKELRNEIEEFNNSKQQQQDIISKINKEISNFSKKLSENLTPNKKIKINGKIKYLRKIIENQENMISSFDSQIQKIDNDISQLNNSSYECLREKYFKNYHNININREKFKFNKIISD
jgi:predicted RNase H-like nuclease (RuvC/YqgF family)